MENLLLSVLCGAGVAVAALLAWHGRNRPLVTDRLTVDDQTPGAAALDALRTIATVLGAGLVAGLLVPDSAAVSSCGCSQPPPAMPPKDASPTPARSSVTSRCPDRSV